MTVQDSVAKGTVRAILIRANGDAELLNIVPTLQVISGLVGGYIETITPMVDGFGHWHAYVDEEGKLKGLPRNYTGQDVAVMLGWGGELAGDYLVGPVLFLGPGREGEEGDVPKPVIDAVLSFYDRHGEVRITSQ